ncbi:MAG: SDR family oxidoreductase [Lentisphaeria bacterium]|nr:SDR family oxidoreductase [Lentisphaeria bacterium]
MNILLTGITGLVGASVVTALLRNHPDFKIVAICRGNSAQTAQERTELTMRAQCEFDGDPASYDSIISRITVISGDVTRLPFDEIAKYGPYDVMFHCAADVNLGKDPEGKTYATNMNGTLNAVEAVKRFGIPRFQYVSTAYVAGTFAGRVMEDTMPATGWINSYERSKFDAEKYVRENVGVPYTIYRPSIIVGRRSDGVIRKPLAFYRILEFLGRIKSNRAFKAGLPANAQMEVNIRIASATSDKIYFVPIDYVQESMSRLFMVPEKNRTYHITGDSPVSTEMIGVACRDILKVTGLRTVDKNDDPSKDEKLVMRMIEDLIPYFSTQITFDNSNVRADLGDEILNWKLDVPFLRRMAYSYYKQEIPGIVEGMDFPKD